MRKRKPNLRDVAHRAGVSPATVSRVLNGSEMVSQTMREHVQQVIDALGFVPNSAARAINSGRTRLVGALIPTLDHAIYARFIDAIEDTLDQLGLSLIVAGTNGESGRELVKAKRLLNIGVEGLIVSGITRARDFDALVTRHRVPVISTSYFDDSYTYPTIGYDNARAAVTAFNHLKSLGHQNIAVLSGPTSTNDRTVARLEAIKHISEAPLLVRETDLTFETAAQLTSEILNRHQSVTALLCLSDVMAQAALLCAGSVGIRVPSDLSVIGIDDLPSSASFAPPLTTVHLPVTQMGRHAGKGISDWIETGSRPDGTELASTLIVRRSTAAPPR